MAPKMGERKKKKIQGNQTAEIQIMRDGPEEMREKAGENRSE